MATSNDVSPAVRLHPRDNVVIARADLPAGAAIAAERVTAASRIPAGHKIAVTDIAAGAPVLRYGQVIGFASDAIPAGAHVHEHNLTMGELELDYAFCRDTRETAYADPPASFRGYLRADGRAATRNYVAVISSVNCSATAVHQVADAFRLSGELADYPNVDGVVALAHGSGCGLADRGRGFEVLERVLTGYARHVNFGAVVLIGLGCEVMQLRTLLADAGLQRDARLASMTIQGVGGTRRTVEQACARVREMLPDVDRVERQALSASELCLALQCGGSDGYSGFTANPALGAAVDRLVRHGGGAILSETPEIYGAQHLLTRRATSPDVAQRLLDRIRWWEDYTRLLGAEMNNNPSPGNKAGGITTIVEKSLGAVAKGGTTNLTAVYEYAEPVSERGLVFMDSPGYDPVSATGQVAAGANVLCFTTGRGSAFGCKPVPSIKLATNSRLYRHQTEDMDLDCGGIATGSETVDACGERIFRKILAVASGQKTASETLGYGDHELVPWQLGATM